MTHHDAAVHLHLAHPQTAPAFFVGACRTPAPPHAAAAAIYRPLARFLHDHRLHLVQERIFGSLSVRPDVLAARHAALPPAFAGPDAPITYVEGMPPWGPGLAGVIVRAVPAAELLHPVAVIHDRDHPVGRTWQDAHATWVVLQGLGAQPSAGRPADPPAQQTRQTIELAHRLLAAHGLDFTHVVRTWFYLSDILAWYPDFNHARSELYQGFGLFPAPEGDLLLPASTAISGRNPAGAALSLDLLALKPHHPCPDLVRRLSNPRQEEAFRYGSAFARGAVVRLPCSGEIQVSGAAAIDLSGASLHPGDLEAQIASTLDCIAALLAEENAGLTDVTAGTVFVKRSADGAAFWRWAQAHDLQDLPAVTVLADVCRPELLFELDAEAALPASVRPAGPLSPRQA